MSAQAPAGIAIPANNTIRSIIEVAVLDATGKTLAQAVYDAQTRSRILRNLNLYPGRAEHRWYIVSGLLRNQSLRAEDLKIPRTSALYRPLHRVLARVVGRKNELPIFEMNQEVTNVGSRGARGGLGIQTIIVFGGYGQPISPSCLRH